MDFITFFWLYLISVPIFFAIDMVYLGYLANAFYQRHIGHILGDVRWPSAIGFYLVYLVGLVFFAIYPAYEEASVATALVLGGLFGFFTYATYDMTNRATLPDWPWPIVWADILWGTALGSLVSVGTVALALLII